MTITFADRNAVVAVPRIHDGFFCYVGQPWPGEMAIVYGESLDSSVRLKVESPPYAEASRPSSHTQPFGCTTSLLHQWVLALKRPFGHRDQCQP